MFRDFCQLLVLETGKQVGNSSKESHRRFIISYMGFRKSRQSKGRRPIHFSLHSSESLVGVSFDILFILYTIQELQGLGVQ